MDLTINADNSFIDDSIFVDPNIQAKIFEFNQNGFIIMEKVFSREIIEEFKTKAMECFREVLEDGILSKGKVLGIGIKNGFKEIVQRHHNRFEMPFKMKEIGALFFSDNHIIKALISNILGDDYHIVNTSLVISSPGALDQAWHSDGPHMSVNEHLPCHCLNVFINLVDVELENGPTSFRPGSHYLTIDFKNKFMSAFIKKQLQPIQTPELKVGDILIVKPFFIYF